MQQARVRWRNELKLPKVDRPIVVGTARSGKPIADAETRRCSQFCPYKRLGAARREPSAPTRMIGRASLAKRCLVLLAVQLALADAYCYRKNQPKSQESAELLQQPGNYSIWVCVQSDNPRDDLAKALKPNTTQVWFSMSRLPKLWNGTFAEFAERLVKVEVWRSELAEIEDAAFKGLTELKGLVLVGNELTTVKAVWFKETPKLLEVNLANNRISSFELDALKRMPALLNLDLRGNDLLVLPPDFVKSLPGGLRRLSLYNNPLNFKQMSEIADWTKSKDERTSSESRMMRELKHVLNVTRSCLDDKVLVDKSNEAIDRCVAKRLANEIAVIAAGNITNTATTVAAAVTTAKP